MAEWIIFLVMLAVFTITAFAFKLPIGVCMMIASLAGAVVDGQGIPLRHMFEGSFGYLNTILVIAAAMLFMKSIQKSGLLETVARFIIDKFRNVKVLLLAGITLLVMFPGMITGSSTACVLTTGTLVVPVLMYFGVPKQKTGAIIAMAALYGMLAPPVNLPAMIIGAGIDMPYVGFFKPLLLATVPIAIVTTWLLGLPHMLKKKTATAPDDQSVLPKSYMKEHGAKILLPFLVLIALMTLPSVFKGTFPDLGMPLVMLVSAAVAMVTGKKFNPLEAVREAVHDAIPVMSILMGVGMFIQIMTLTGVRGFIVVSSLSIPSALLLLAMAVTIPLFGAVSAFGAASVLGVPFLLTLSGSGNAIILTAGITLLVSLGDLMPPTALAGIFAAQVVDEPNYFKVLRYCLLPALLTVATALLIIANSASFAKWMM